MPQTIRQLSARELEVLGYMAEGLSNQAIGDELHLSARTVETHVRNIFLKLGLRHGARHDRRVVAVLAYLAER